MILNVGAGGASTAEAVQYDNSNSGLEADNVQGAVDELNNSMTADNAQLFQFAYDSESGKYGYKVKEAGTDVFVPFKSGGDIQIGSITAEGYTSVSLSHVSKTGKNLVVATGSRYGQKKNVYLNCACDNENSIVTTIGSASRMNIDASYSSAISVFMVECVAGDTITATATGDVNVNGGIVIFDL